MSYLKNGNKAFKNKDYGTAIDFYHKALFSGVEIRGLLEFNISLAEKKLSNKSSFFTDAPWLSDEEKVTKYEVFDAVHPAAQYLMNCQRYKVDIVIPVYNALDDVKRCLISIDKNRDGFLVNVIVVNDASDFETTKFLKDYCSLRDYITLIEHDENKMYTKTVNDGLRVAQGDYVVTLNSDAIVSKGWLQGLVRCIRSSEKIGIVGPLSNAASWQNVPELLDESSQFAVNDIPFGFSVDEMADYVREVSHHLYPRVPFVNGFCFMISRAVIDKIGFLDEEIFPTGYGEENDYCIRAGDAGFELAIADDVYVFHAKSKSFGHEKRKEYSKNGSQNLKAKHGKDRVNELVGRLRGLNVFEEIRSRIKNSHHELKEKSINRLSCKKILFLLPVSGGGGGVHSIVQETMGMQRIGVDAKIAVPAKHLHKFMKVYEDVATVEDLFVGFAPDDMNSLASLTKNYDVIVGTIFTSMKMIKKLREVNKSIRAAYYIQDYEPFFSEPGSPAWQEAYDSYTLIPGATLFAKTDWIRNKVFDEHGVAVYKVAPSIDHDVYKPSFEPNDEFNEGHPIIVTAMIRPKTPRRGADRTMRLLKKLKLNMRDKVEIEIFGCEDKDPLFLKLDRDFDYNNNGTLSRNGVAAVLQRSHFFLDLSDYQAFGRTGLEAMACGAISLVTEYGGADEYIREPKYLLDVFDEDGLYESVFDIINSDFQKYSPLLTAAAYSIHSAAISEISIL